MYSMETLRVALTGDGSLELLKLLFDCVLPVLVSSLELLSVAELAWATGGDLEQVSDLSK